MHRTSDSEKDAAIAALTAENQNNKQAIENLLAALHRLAAKCGVAVADYAPDPEG